MHAAGPTLGRPDETSRRVGVTMEVSKVNTREGGHQHASSEMMMVTTLKRTGVPRRT